MAQISSLDDKVGDETIKRIQKHIWWEEGN